MIDKKKKITLGILAHVDAGKTTLSEALLYKAGVIRKLGRVDHQDAFMDFDVRERNRGITIFSGQAEFAVKESEFVLLDTPGHVDFCAEMERTLSVLDYAILLISGKDGIQAHTTTLWRLLKSYNIPTFIFVNKMDIKGTESSALMEEIQEAFGRACFDVELAKASAPLVQNSAEAAKASAPLAQGSAEAAKASAPLAQNSVEAAKASAPLEQAYGEAAKASAPLAQNSVEAAKSSAALEDIAMCDETLLEEFLESETISRNSLAKAIKSRRLFPCFFGSALKLTGIDELINGLDELTLIPDYLCDDADSAASQATSTAANAAGRVPSTAANAASKAPSPAVNAASQASSTAANAASRAPSTAANAASRAPSASLNSAAGIETIGNDNLTAVVYKISRDKQGERLTHIKIMRGELKVRDTVNSEKVTQIRKYSGDKYRTVDSAGVGDLCAITGLEGTSSMTDAMLRAVMSYGLILPKNVNIHDAFMKLKQLEEEDPQLNITWDERHHEIRVKIMGRVQLEVLQEIIKERFGLDAEFGEGRIAYRETIKKPITGAGHYEPLRHYAEVQILLEPLPRGSGMVFRTAADEDVLDRNWQRLIMTHLSEKEHLGALTASPISDIRITILTGRAHEKHTEGGDFRQATYRAIRQALRKSKEAGEAVLLEPWYKFELEVPQEMLGRAMSDIQRMGGEFELESTLSGQVRDPMGSTFKGKIQHPAEAMLTGKAPISEMKDYFNELASYSKGYGHLTCEFAGYEACHNQDEVVDKIDYDVDRDVENSADSIFCSHGAGHNVPWDEADEMMHTDCRSKLEELLREENAVPGEMSNSALGEAGNSVPGDAENASSRESGNAASRETGNKQEREVFAKAERSEIERRPSEDKELQRIFDRTYNKETARKKWKPRIEAREIDSEQTRKRRASQANASDNGRSASPYESGAKEYLIVDGYNIIFAWEELKELAKINIDSARGALIDILCNYQGFRNCELIVVFDAYKVKGGKRHVDRYENITVVYTQEAETADTFIERTTFELAGKGSVSGKGMASGKGSVSGKGMASGKGSVSGKGMASGKGKASGDSSGKRPGRVRVATSDRLEQMIIMGNDAQRVSAPEFKNEVEQVNTEISEYIKKLTRKNEIENPNKLEMPEPAASK